MTEEKPKQTRKRNIVDYRTASKAVYEEFCKAHPNVSITFKQYSNILYTYNRMFRDYVLESGDKFRMPFGFGDVSIRKWKKDKINTNPYTGEKHVVMAIDWIKTMQQGKHVYIFNNHTDGFRFQWKWFKGTVRFECNNIFVMKPTRDTSRKIAEYIKKNPQHYHIYREWPKS